MQNITGKIAFGGIAIGKIKEISKENNVVRRVKIEDAKAEIARFEAARDQAAEELKGLYDKAVKEVGEANAAIFEVHQMMLEDEDYLDSVRNIIEAQSVNAEFAVATTGDNFARMFADMDDDYMKERAADVKDISEETLREYEKKQQDEKNRQELLQQLKGKPTVTKEGKEIKLYANIGEVKDLGAVLQNDAAGIGLFRSEFLYLQSDHFPTEDEQFQSYKTVAEVMAGKKVIIRTLDIGADKQIDYFGLEHEDNPALGYRAVRICLDQPDIFKTQLRALLRASMFGNISIMIPMIASVWEVRKVKEIMEEVKAELTSEGIPFKNVEFGIMIETPAAVMIADELAKEVDFFSIGTNDLTQYTLAIDRQNAKLDQFYDSHHPAVLKMIQMVIDSAHKAGIWAGICGELGADLTLTETFVKMGIDELSVSPAMVLPVRDKILNA